MTPRTAAKVAAVLTILIILVGVLTGCGSQDKLNGKVTDKSVDPGFYFTMLVPIPHTSCSGNPSVCTTYYTYIPILYWVPTCYEIEVKGETKEDSGTTCLEEDAWNDIEIGDTYVGPDVDPKDRKQERERGEERDSK